MAAAASLRVLEGNFQGSTRAASAFLATTLGLGPILQVAFPVIGALALIEILGRIPQAFDKIEDSIAGWDKAREKAFKDATRKYRRSVLTKRCLGESKTN
jgi:hypothetical protein